MACLSDDLDRFLKTDARKMLLGTGLFIVGPDGVLIETEDPDIVEDENGD